MGIPHDVEKTDTLVRRSSRSNKGQHSKLAGQRKKRKIDIVEDDDGETRCLCGDNEDDGEFMIQCESCRKWQHGICMGFKDSKKFKEPYACEICRPDQYKNVSVKEEGTKKTEKTTAKKKPPPKEKTVQPVTKMKLIFKKPEKRKTPPSDESSDDDSEFTSDEDDIPIMQLPSIKKTKRSPSITTTPPPTKAKSPSTEPRKKPPPINTARRPSQASPQQQRRPSAAEQRRSSTSATPSTPHPLAKTPLATTFGELSDQKRVPAARIFAKIFEPIDSTKSEALGLAIEHALYSAFATSEHGYGEAYKNKFRSISFNLKDPKNSALRERVLTGQLPTEDLVKMSSEDMANQELREQAEKIREESVAQSVLKVQTGPRIRRTHKGEELVGGDDISAITPTEGTASAPFAPRVEKMSPSVRGEEEVPASPRSVDSIGSRSFTPPHQDTEMTDITSIDRKPSTSNFDLEHVWSHLRSPTFPNDEPSSEPMNLDIFPDDLPQNQIDDPDIDRIINEDPTNNSPPYSPSAYEYQLPNTAENYPPIWTGDLAMPSVAHFAAQARFVGGPHSVTDLPWSNILPQHLVIDGRIAIDTTTKYLAAQRSSSTKSIIVLQIVAEQTHKEMHRKLFQYFHDRQRYGVLQIQSNIVRDAYIVPLAPDQPIPEAVESMDSHDIPRSRTEPYILAILVIQKQIPTEISRSPVTGFSPGVAAPPPVTSPPTAEIATQQFSPLGASPFTAVAASQQPVTYSPPAVWNPIEALGLSTADLAALQGVLIAHPEILSDPQILTNPAILQNLLQQHLSGQRW
jgi:hypothetical protein